MFPEKCKTSRHINREADITTRYAASCMQAGHSPRTVVASSNSVASIQCGNPVGSDTRFMTGERTCLMLSRPRPVRATVTSSDAVGRCPWRLSRPLAAGPCNGQYLYSGSRVVSLEHSYVLATRAHQENRFSVRPSPPTDGRFIPPASAAGRLVGSECDRESREMFNQVYATFAYRFILVCTARLTHAMHTRNASCCSYSVPTTTSGATFCSRHLLA